MQFDNNAEVEPLNQDHNFYIDYGDLNNDLDELNEEEQAAILRCRGLKHPTVLVEDMQPVENTSLEYTYRPLDNIGNNWAGPWKFLQTVKSSNHTRTDQKANLKKKSRKLIKELTFDDFSRFQFSHVKKSIKFKKLTPSRHNWDAKKLKLPCDHKIDPEIFVKFKYAPNFDPADANRDNLENNLSRIEVSILI